MPVVERRNCIEVRRYDDAGRLAGERGRVDLIVQPKDVDRPLAARDWHTEGLHARSVVSQTRHKDTSGRRVIHSLLARRS